MSKSMKALVLAGVLSFAAASAHAGGRGGMTGEFHNGANAPTSSQSQGQNGGHVHNDGGRGGLSGDV